MSKETDRLLIVPEGEAVLERLKSEFASEPGQAPDVEKKPEPIHAEKLRYENADRIYE